MPHTNKLRTVLPRVLNRVLALTVMTAICFGVFAYTASAQTTYLVTDGAVSTTLVAGHDADVLEVLTKAGLTVEGSDFVSSDTGGSVKQVRVHRLDLVSVVCDGTMSICQAEGRTVAQVLASLGITLGPEDYLNYGLNEPARDSMVVEVTRVRRAEETTRQTVACGTLTCRTDALEYGQTQVLSPGKDGERTVTELVTYENDREVSRETLSSVVTRMPVAQVLLVGTQTEARTEEPDIPSGYDLSAAKSVVGLSQPAPAAEADVADTESGSTEAPDEPGAAQEPVLPDNAIVTVSGEVLTYTRVLSCEATAYTCEGKSWNITATGTTARYGEIAVDPSVIALGSRLYVVSDDGYCVYGVCTAEDTGGAIKGNRIDLYFDTYNECINFGRRQCTVYVLE